MKGTLIYFEGGEGTGKTTQRNRLAPVLEGDGYVVHRAHEPGGGLGEAVRELIFLPEIEQLSKERRRLYEYCLFTADRIVHAEKLRKILDEGNVVLSDRGPWSTVVYQGYGEGMDIDRIITTNNDAMGSVKEDLVILLDGDPSALRERVVHRGGTNRFDNKPMEYHHKIREGFLLLARQHGWPVVDALQDESTITSVLREIICERIGI